MDVAQEHGARSRAELLRNLGWTALAVLAWVALALAVLGVVEAIADRDWLYVVGLPVTGAFCFWIAGGAWRRTTWGRAS